MNRTRHKLGQVEKADPLYRAVPGAKEGEGEEAKWFDALARREISAVTARAIAWPKSQAARMNLFRDWHVIATHRVQAAKAGNDLLGQVWAFVNMTSHPGLLWPSNEVLAARAGVSNKTISRQAAHYSALGIFIYRQKWVTPERKSRVMEMTFPADLTKANFAGKAFTEDAWDRCLGSDYRDHSGPDTSESIGTISTATIGTMHGPENVDMNEKGAPSAPPDPQRSTINVVSTEEGQSESSQDRALEAPSCDDEDSLYHPYMSFPSLAEESAAIDQEFERQVNLTDPDDEARIEALTSWRESTHEETLDYWTGRAEEENRGAA